MSISTQQTFYGQEWLFRGTKRAQIDFAEAAKCDLVLLTQSLDDHLHQPTLRRMDKATPIVCPPSAVGILRTLGFRNLTVVDHNQSAPVLGKLVITGTVGALVGPPWSKRENGYVIQEPSSGLRLYYEPHADYDAKSVAAVGAVDVVISCVKTQGLGKQGVGSYPLVMGADNTIPLVKQLRPSVLIPLFNAEFETSGPLTTIMTTRGSLEEAAEGLRRAGVPAVIALPDATAGVPREIEVPVRGSVKEVQVLT